MLLEGTKQFIAKLTDEELVEYATNDDEGYTEEAIRFARDEIARRGIDAQRVAAIETSARDRRIGESKQREEIAARPLGWGPRIALLIIGMPALVVTIALYLRFRERGERSKFFDLIIFGSIGSIIQIAGMRMSIFPWSLLPKLLHLGGG